jgi:RNA-directed DNA polymerase
MESRGFDSLPAKVSHRPEASLRAIVMLLEPIYEQDFRDCSFGFRAGRNAHQALRGSGL